MPQLVVADVPVVVDPAALPEEVRPLIPQRTEALILVSAVHDGTIRAINYARSLRCAETRALFVALDPSAVEPITRAWEEHHIPIQLDIVEAPFRELGTPNPDPTLDALENVEAGMAPLGMRSRSRREGARQLLEEVGLDGRVRHLPSQLSGGEQQRVAIARALAKNPRVLLADEPTGNLDSKIGAEIIELIALFSERRRQTVVLVTHDAEASRYASRTFRMRDGRLLDDARLALAAAL